MTRTEAIAIIEATLPTLDDAQAAALAELARSMSGPIPLELTDEERAGVDRARDDFRAGRTHSSAEARAMTAARIEELRRQPDRE